MFPVRSAENLGHALVSIFFPDRCRLCESVLSGWSAAPVCADCLAELQPLSTPYFCARCGLPFESPAPLHGDVQCGACRRFPPAFEQTRCYGVYEGRLRRLIHLLKYERMEPLAKPLAEGMAATIPS